MASAFHFEHDRPDTVGLPPARQRDIMLAMARSIRAKLARWAAFLRHRPHRSRLAVDQNRLEDADFITLPIPGLDPAGSAKKESGEDR